VKKAIGKCLRKITSGIGRIRNKRLASQKIPSFCRSGLQTASDRTSGATGGNSSKPLGYLKIPSSCQSGLKRAADRSRSATRRIGRACSKRLASLRIPSSWRSGKQRAAYRIGGAIGRIGRIYGERSSGTCSWWSAESTDVEESLLIEATTSEDITDREVFVSDDDLWWSL
jgi:hypothetical protein